MAGTDESNESEDNKHCSDDAENWHKQDDILGDKADGQPRATHCDVIVRGDHAYCFYTGNALFVALLEVHAGKLTAVRNRPFDFTLAKPESGSDR